MQDPQPSLNSADAAHLSSLSNEHRAPTLIAADVGGTWARLAWVQPCTPEQPLRLQGQRSYACADYPSLAAIIREFRATGAATAVTAVVAIAGVMDGDTLVNTNLPWSVSLSATAAEAGLQQFELLNDFEAVAHAIADVPAASLRALNGEHSPQPHCPALILGPGTGLGAALKLDNPVQPVLPSEAGHAALAPTTPLEQEILQLLMQRWPHVDIERVLSGTGLMNLYPCLCQLRGSEPVHASAAELVAAARAGEPLALETVQVFCGWLGSACADMAITFGARSVYLAGGVAGHLQDFLCQGEFQRRFRAKGVFAGILEQVPVWLVEHGELGVLGAAAWHRWRQRSS